MDLDPYYIKENIDDIGLKEGFSILKDWINNSNDISLRKSALEVYNELDDGKSFRFFEQLFLSDEDIEIRLLAGEFLKQNYFHHPKLIALLEFTLFNEKNIELKFLAIEILNSLKSRKAFKIIKNFLKKVIKKHFLADIKSFPKDIFSIDHDFSIQELHLEICFNIILYLFYTYEKGYNVILKNGIIILLDCEGCNLKYLSQIPAFDRLTRLEHLMLRRNQIYKIQGLDHLKNLKVLDLSENRIQKIENLENLEKLEELKLSMNRVKKIENLNVKKMRKLSLDHNLIIKIENLEELIHLELLNLSHNRIRKMENLKKLVNLKSLNLSVNIIEEISQLDCHAKLVSLRLNDNSIKQICCLNNLLELKTLNLSNNLIERIEGFQNLKNLTKLELSNNKIRKIEGIDNLTKLQELFLDKNLIVKLEGLKNLKSLIILFLENNRISEFRIQDLDNLENLNFIYLNDNPLTSESRVNYEKRTRFP